MSETVSIHEIKAGDIILAPFTVPPKMNQACFVKHTPLVVVKATTGHDRTFRTFTVRRVDRPKRSLVRVIPVHIPRVERVTV